MEPIAVFLMARCPFSLCARSTLPAVVVSVSCWALWGEAGLSQGCRGTAGPSSGASGKGDFRKGETGPAVWGVALQQVRAGGAPCGLAGPFCWQGCLCRTCAGAAVLTAAWWGLVLTDIRLVLLLQIHLHAPLFSMFSWHGGLVRALGREGSVPLC